MTPQEEKELAEFGAEFLRLAEAPNKNGWMLRVRKEERFITQDDFSNDDFSPILAHLAKREMEKRGFEWAIGSYDEEDGDYHARFWPSTENGEGFNISDDNEYIALWLAIREAVKDD